MSDAQDEGRRLYKVRGPDGEDAWVDHDELWRLQQGQAEALRRERVRRQRLVLLGLAALVALALVLVFWRMRAGVERAPARSAEAPPRAVAVEPGPAPDLPAAEETGPPPVESEPAPAPSAAERVADAVGSWAAAWARQDVTAYLAGYATDFEPAGGLTRSSWESLRRSRLETPASIRLEIEGLEIGLGEDGGAEARFLQTYASPAYSDVVRKTLVLVEEEGEWRIVRELAEAP